MDKLYLDRMEWEERCAAVEREEQRKALLANPETAQRYVALLPAVWTDQARWQALMVSMTDVNARRRRREQQRRKERS